jgi:hypothetical protein
MHDTFTVLFTLIVLLAIGATIYAYTVQSPYSHYSLAISIGGVLALVLLTKSTVAEKDLDMIGLNLGPSDTRRVLRWGSEKKVDYTGGKRKHKRS